MNCHGIQINSEISWVIDNKRTIIVSSKKNVIIFSMDESIMWNLIQYFSKMDDIIEIAKAVFNINNFQAHQKIETTLNDWRKKGLIQ